MSDKSLKLAPGSIVDFYSDGVILSGVVMTEEKGRLRVVTEKGRDERIAPGRVLAAHDGDPRLAAIPKSGGDGARTEAAKRAAAAHAEGARARVGTIDLATVWELLGEDSGEKRLQELAEVACGDASPLSQAATLRALLDERIHFSRRGDLWQGRSREGVADILRQREEERRRAEERERFFATAKAALIGAAPFARPASGEGARLLTALEEVAVFGQHASAGAVRDAAIAIESLRIPGGTPEAASFELLRRLGIFTEDENLFVRRFGVRPAFPPEIGPLTEQALAATLGDAQGSGSRAPAGREASAARMQEALAREIQSGGRRDLTQLAVFSVDDEATSEIDDTLSVESLGEGRFRIGIHIADPGFIVRPRTELDALIADRAVTFYLPDMRVLMLPPAIAENAASLLPDVPRPALSFFATLDSEGSLLGSEITPSVVRSHGRLSYEDASAAVVEARQGPIAEQVRVLHVLAVALEKSRIAMGAHVIRAPEVDLRVTEDGTIVLKRLEGDDPGRLLVSEMMILASRLAASFCQERAVPCIYRRQPPSEEPVPPVLSGPYDPVAVRRARRGLKRSETGLAPGRHFALGLEAYAQATSPIRRYQDLVIHRQIVAVLRTGAPCYDAEALAGIVAVTDEAERIARLAERGSDEYWTLKYLARLKGSPVEGVVVSTDRRRVEVELSETLYTTSIAPRPDHEVGQKLMLQVEEVNPRTATLTLRQLG